MLGTVGGIYSRFNPRTYIRYDIIGPATSAGGTGFNPRTYIRYDYAYDVSDSDKNVSIHVPI